MSAKPQAGGGKQVKAIVKLVVPAGKANPSPPIGPALGQQGLNIMEFCKAFNDKTKDVEPGAPIPVEITAFADRTFTFITKLPTVTHFIMKAVKIAKGSATPGRQSAGKITKAQIKKIAEEKMVDMNATTVAAAMNSVAGSARAMGLEVVEG